MAGETVPADGVIQAEYVSVDESMMTGESIPTHKTASMSVFGGTIVVEGSCVVLVTACGDDSALGKIVSTVQDAQSSKPPIQEVADKVCLMHCMIALASPTITIILLA